MRALRVCVCVCCLEWALPDYGRENTHIEPETNRRRTEAHLIQIVVVVAPISNRVRAVRVSFVKRQTRWCLVSPPAHVHSQMFA